MAPTLRLSTAPPDVSQHKTDVVRKTGERRIPDRATGRFHRPELDRLRFAAFFLVFLHHAMPASTAGYIDAGLPRIAAQGLAAFARAGGFGVDLFFALSAYLITELLLREQARTGTIAVRKFYIRRILRIWPLYFLALLVLAPAMSWIVPGEAMPAGHLAGYLLLSGNWASAFWGFPASSFALLWSVSIEEQFYLLWPWLTRRFSARLPVLAAMMLVLAWSTRVLTAAGGIEHPGVWCNTLARLDPIAGGALMAFYLQGRGSRISPSGRGLLVVGGVLLMIGLGAVGNLAGWQSLYTYPLATTACLGILCGSLSADQEPAPRRASSAWHVMQRGANSVLGHLGKISFGLYVFHVAVIRVTEAFWGGQFNRLTLDAAALLLTILAATVSYRFLETPFLRLKERFAVVSSRPV